jgi:hypothetical protein
MIRLRQGSLIVTLFLLTAAATAYGECAWVVWEHRSMWKGSATTIQVIDWAPTTASLARSSCDSSIANRIKATAKTLSLVSRPKDTITPMDDTLIWTWEDPDGTKGAHKPFALFASPTPWTRARLRGSDDRLTPASGTPALRINRVLRVMLRAHGLRRGPWSGSSSGRAAAAVSGPPRNACPRLCG